MHVDLGWAVPLYVYISCKWMLLFQISNRVAVCFDKCLQNASMWNLNFNGFIWRQQILKEHLGNWHWVGPVTLHIHMNSVHVPSQGNSRRWAQDVPPLARSSESRGSHTVQPLLRPVAHSDCHCEAAFTALSWGRGPGYNPAGMRPLSGHSCSPFRPHKSLLLGDCLWLDLSSAFWILFFSSKKGFTVCNNRSTHGRPSFLTVCQAPCGLKQCTEAPNWEMEFRRRKSRCLSSTYWQHGGNKQKMAACAQPLSFVASSLACPTSRMVPHQTLSKLSPVSL